MNNKACMNLIKLIFHVSNFKFELKKFIEPTLFSFSFRFLALCSKSIKLKAKPCLLYKILFLQLHMIFNKLFLKVPHFRVVKKAKL